MLPEPSRRLRSRRGSSACRLEQHLLIAHFHPCQSPRPVSPSSAEPIIPSNSATAAHPAKISRAVHRADLVIRHHEGTYQGLGFLTE